MKTQRSIRDILSGSSTFLHDHQVENPWSCRIIRSTIRRGKIHSLLVDPEFISSGAFLIQEKDLPGQPARLTLFGEGIPILSGEHIHFYGQPVALLVAESREQLNAAERMIQIRYEEFPPLPDVLKDPQQIHRESEKSLGDPGLMWEQSVESVESFYQIGTQTDSDRDQLGYIAQLKGNELQVIGPSIWPHLIADTLARILRCPVQRLDIIPTNPGVFYDHLLVDGSLLAILAGIAAEISGHNVELFLPEDEQQLFGSRQPPISVRQRMGLDENRNVLVNDLIVDVNVGAFPFFSTEIINHILSAAPGFYRSASWRVRIHLFRSNLPPMNIFHGFPSTLSQIPAEIQANRLAELEGENPLIWRQRHFLRAGDTAPPEWSLREGMDRKKALNTLNAMSDFVRKYAAYELLRKRRKAGKAFSRQSLGEHFRGIGMAYGFYPSGFSRTMEKELKARVRVSLLTDGSVHGYATTAPGTTAAKLLLRKIIKEELNVDSAQVHLHTSDCREVPDSGPVCLSRSLTVVTENFRQACRALQKQRFHKALPLSVENVFRLPRQPAWDQQQLKGDPFLYRSYGALAMDIELDPVSMIPEIRHIWMVVDAPSFFNVNQARSALEGGIIQCLEWVRGWPVRYRDGVLELEPQGIRARGESRRPPRIEIEFLPGTKTDRDNQNGFRDLPYALVPPAYLSALSQATGGYFDSIPTDSQLIFSYLQDSEEAGDED